MKKICLSFIMVLSVLFTGCKKEEIVFEHEKPQFELKDNAILLEVIVPTGTSAKDQIYIVGAFNGQDTVNYVNADYCLQKAEKVDSKYGIYLYPEDFVDGKSLADGFLFVSKLQGIETPATPHVLDCQVGQRYDISIANWGGVAAQPEIEHDGYVVYTLDETGWDNLNLYMWGEVNDLNGGWPGMAVTGTETIDGVTYKYFDMGASNEGLAENIIFNDGNGAQLSDFAYTINRDIYLHLTADGVEEINAEPEIEHDGYVVYVIDSTGWDALTLYMWGDVNDLNGSWPGMTVTGTQTINGKEYKYFDMGEANTGKAENLIFSNNGADQLKDYAYTIDHDVYLIVTLSGVREEGTEPEPEPDPEPKDTVNCTIYIQDLTGWECFSVYSWGNDYEAFGAWPGITATESYEIESVTYGKYDVTGPQGNTMNLIFTNKGCVTDSTGVQYDAIALEIIKDTTYYIKAEATSATLITNE